MGGEIGLIMGASILSFFEVIDLLLFLIYNLLLTPLHNSKREEKDSESVLARECEEIKDIEEFKVEGDEYKAFANGANYLAFVDFPKTDPLHESTTESFQVGSWKSGSEYEDGDRVTTL